MNSAHCSRCVCACVRASTAPGVCVLGWVKCREQNCTAGYTLYNYVKKKKKNDIFLYITDYGKMLKYRSTDISVDL